MTNSDGILTFYSIFDIKISFDNVQKENIYLNITKLLTSFVDKNQYIIYETNITEMPRITTNSFIISPNRNDNTNCFFKKNNDQDKLLLLCYAESSGFFSLGTIQENNLNDINIFYNFKIIASQNNEESFVSYDKEGTKIFLVYPELLDFSSKEKLIINYQTDNPDKLIGVRLNYGSSSYLECQNKNGVKECIVPKSHFTKSGDYYTYYENSYGYKSILYEIPKIKVILNGKNSEQTPDDSEDNLVGIIIGSVIGGLIVVGIIVFFVYRFYRKKNADLGEKNEGNLPSSTEVELQRAE